MAIFVTKTVPMILFDSERLKHPYQGFYTYCDSLGKALASEARRRMTKMAFYVPKKDVGRFGYDMKYLECGLFDRYFLRCPSYVDLWHCSRQRSGYMPDICRASVLLTVHDISFAFTGAEYKRAKAMRECRSSIQRSDRIVTISEFAKKQLYEYMDPGDRKVDVVYNGLPLYEGETAKPAVCPDGDFLLCVSRITPYKNQKVLLPLLLGNDLKLVLAGMTNKYRYDVEIMDQARRLGVADRVIFTGAVSEAEKYWLMDHCLAFLFPSLAEGFGLPVLEAMSRRKPVFTSDRTSLPEITGEWGFYFNHDFDPEGMREDFEKGMQCYESQLFDKDKMVSHAKSFSWEKAACEYFNIYEQMLADGRR